MVTETLRAEMDLPYDDCFADELATDFANQSKKVCYEMATNPGQVNADSAKLLSECLAKESFCNSCCNFHVGLIHVQKRNNCAEECNAKIHAGDEDLGVKASGDAVDVRIPRN